MSKAALSREVVLQIAGRAGCDKRTVESYLSGGTTRKLVTERIEAAMRDLELPVELPAVKTTQ